MPKNELILAGKKFITSKKAAGLFGYTQDYIGQLCRGDKIDARRIGRTWYISEESIFEHKKLYGGSELQNKEIISSEIKKIPINREESQNQQILNIPDISNTQQSEVSGFNYEKESMPFLPTIGSADANVAFSVGKIVRLLIQKSFGFVLSVALVFGGYAYHDEILAQVAKGFHTTRNGVITTVQKIQELSLAQLSEIQPLSFKFDYIENFALASKLYLDKSLTPEKFLALVEKVLPEKQRVALESVAKITYRELHPFFQKTANFFVVLFGKQIPTDFAQETSGEKVLVEVFATKPNFETPVVVKDRKNLETSEQNISSGGQTIVLSPRNVIQEITKNISYVGISREEFENRFQDISTKLFGETSRLFTATANNNTYINNVYSTVAGTNNLDMLHKVTISDSSTFTGGTVTASTITDSPISGSTGSFTTLSVSADASFATTTITKDLAVDIDTLYVDSVNNRVGIGTTSPYAKLSVVGEVVATNFTATSSTATSTFRGGVLFATDGGNVGIGTTSPSEGVLVINTTGVTAAKNNAINIVNAKGIGAGAGIIFHTDTSPTLGDVFNSGRIYSNFVSGAIGYDESYLSLQTPSEEDSWQNTLIARNGRIGIGTLNPLVALQVVGTGVLTGDLHLYGGDIALGTGTATTTLTSSQGNLGIGTTSPAALLSLNPNSTAKGFYMAGYPNSTAELFKISTSTLTATTTAFVIDSNGKVGVGTSTPGTDFAVQGGLLASGVANLMTHCVTGDTKLRRRRRRRSSRLNLGGKKGSTFSRDGDDGYLYDEVAIKDVNEGDEIQTLDQKTGTLVWRKVKGVAFMGTKPIFKLTTASGKTIRTTGNHPYFVREAKVEKIKKKIGIFIDGANVYYSGKQAGWRFDVAKLKKLFAGVFDVRVMNFYSAVPNKDDLSYRQTAEFLRKISSFASVVRKPLKYIDGGKKGNVDIEIALDVVRHLPDLDEVLVVSGDSDYLELWKYVYKEKGKSIRFLSYRDNLAFELKATKYILFEKIRQFVELGKKNTPDLSAGRISLALLYAKSPSMSSGGVWKKVIGLKAGQEIAVSNGKKASWDRIVSIESMPAEDVFDIEVEGTHNFVANGIVAHNTYVGGNLGIGTTSPSKLLSVHGDAIVSGTLSVGNLIATSSTITFSGLGTDMLTALNSSGNLVATSTPTAAAYLATSTTATSTFAGGLAIETSGLVYDYQTNNVGIGTAAPQGKLHVAGNGTSRSLVVTGAADDFSGMLVLGATDLSANGVRIKGNPTNGGVSQIYSDYFTTEGPLVLGTYSNIANQLYLATSGNVGIGTTTPAAKLSVEQGSATTLGMYLSGYANASADMFRISTSTLTATSTAFVIDSQGRVGVGTSTPWAELGVQGRVALSGLTINAAANAVCVDASGEISNANAAACSGVSSARFKNTITDSPLGLSAILAMRSVTFRYNQGYGDSGVAEQFGLIAEEVNEIDSRLVTLDAGGLPTAVRYDFLAPILIEAIQELNMKISSSTASSTDALLASPTFIERFMAKVLEYLASLGTKIAQGLLQVKKLVVDDELCIGSTCLTEAQLAALLQNAGNSSGRDETSSEGFVSGSPAIGPTITIQGNNPANVEVDASYVDLGVMARDSNGNDLSVRYFVNGASVTQISLDTSTSTIYTIDYSATDTNGLTATSTRVVNVGEIT
ncbi:MAG TPA: NYN domain-containing protein, partial [Candidatus Paceibacterota bacterium]